MFLGGVIPQPNMSLLTGSFKVFIGFPSPSTLQRFSSLSKGCLWYPKHVPKSSKTLVLYILLHWSHSWIFSSIVILISTFLTLHNHLLWSHSFGLIWPKVKDKLAWSSHHSHCLVSALPFNNHVWFSSSSPFCSVVSTLHLNLTHCGTYQFPNLIRFPPPTLRPVKLVCHVVIAWSILFTIEIYMVYIISILDGTFAWYGKMYIETKFLGVAYVVKICLIWQ